MAHGHLVTRLLPPTAVYTCANPGKGGYEEGTCASGTYAGSAVYCDPSVNSTSTGYLITGAVIPCTSCSYPCSVWIYVSTATAVDVSALSPCACRLLVVVLHATIM